MGLDVILPKPTTKGVGVFIEDRPRHSARFEPASPPPPCRVEGSIVQGTDPRSGAVIQSTIPGPKIIQKKNIDEEVMGLACGFTPVPKCHIA